MTRSRTSTARWSSTSTTQKTSTASRQPWTFWVTPCYPISLTKSVSWWNRWPDSAAIRTRSDSDPRLRSLPIERFADSLRNVLAQGNQPPASGRRLSGHLEEGLDCRYQPSVVVFRHGAHALLRIHH